MTEHPTCHMCEHWERGVCSYHSKRVPGNCRACIYGHAKPEYRTPAPRQYIRVKLPTQMPVPEPGRTPQAGGTYRDDRDRLWRPVDSAKLKQLIHEWSSQRALARCLDTSAETVSRWLLRHKAVPEDRVQLIAETLGCQPSDFARGIQAPKPNKLGRPAGHPLDTAALRARVYDAWPTMADFERAVGFPLHHELSRGRISPERLERVCKLLGCDQHVLVLGR